MHLENFLHLVTVFFQYLRLNSKVVNMGDAKLINVLVESHIDDSLCGCRGIGEAKRDVKKLKDTPTGLGDSFLFVSFFNLNLFEVSIQVRMYEVRVSKDLVLGFLYLRQGIGVFNRDVIHGSIGDAKTKLTSYLFHTKDR